MGNKTVLEKYMKLKKLKYALWGAVVFGAVHFIYVIFCMYCEYFRGNDMAKLIIYYIDNPIIIIYDKVINFFAITNYNNINYNGDLENIIFWLVILIFGTLLYASIGYLIFRILHWGIRIIKK